MNHLLSLSECLAVIHGWIYCDAASTAKLQKLGSPGSQASGKSILGTALTFPVPAIRLNHVSRYKLGHNIVFGIMFVGKKSNIGFFFFQTWLKDKWCFTFFTVCC